MPVKPASYVLTCARCGWWKVVAPASDCLGPQDFMLSCQKCGHRPLTRAATPVGAWMTQAWRWLKQ